MTETGRPEETRAGVGQLMRDRGYLAFWGAGLLIGVVRWLQLLALGVYAFELTGSPFLVSLIPLLMMAPLALAGPLLGAVADRVDRRFMFRLSIAGACLIASGMAALAQTGALTFTHIAVAAFLAGVFWATDMPIRRRLLGDLSGAALPAAMSLDAATGNGTRMLGPLLGGATLQFMGVAGVFIFSAVAYGICFLLAGAAPTSAPEPKPAVRATLVRDLAAGVAQVMANRYLKRILAITIVFNVFGFPFISMIPVVGADHLGLSPVLVGALSSLEGMGAFLGAVLIAFIASPDNHYRIYWLGVVLYTALIGLLAFATFNAAALPSPFFIVGAILLAIGVAGACFSAMQSTLTYLAADPRFRSRVLGVLTLCIGTGPAGFFAIGWIADGWGAPTALIATSLGGLAGMALIWLSAARRA